MANNTALALHDQSPGSNEFLQDVVAGLAAKRKTLPCKYFYDARGAQLFEQICTLDEYYPTRTELSIMRRYLPEMAAAIGPAARVVEFGSGEGIKTRLLLAALLEPAAYVPIDISLAQLEASAASLNAAFPELEVLPVCADYQSEINLPKPSSRFEKTVVYFPGSTLGNFERNAAVAFLKKLKQVAASQGEGCVLLGLDLQKDPAVLEAAYDDSSAVTAAFNLNLLTRINQELGADFDLNQFQHRARWNTVIAAIEMLLVSKVDQRVTIQDQVFEFSAGEDILTEYSHKYSLDSLVGLAKQAGLQIKNTWLDDRKYFAVLSLSE